MIPHLLEVKRLTRKIKEFLETGSDLSSAQKAAKDYVEVCRAAALRLQQVESVINAGDSAQALQLAEIAPPLPDLLAILDFRESEEWRALCRRESLPYSEPFDANAAALLNNLYDKGISGDHPLYAHYRDAMNSRNEARAHQILRAIVRLNDADTNAHAELSRIDKKVMAAELTSLDSSLTAGDASGALERLQKIESAGFQTDPRGPVWIRALNLRRDMWIQAAEVARSKGLFDDVFDWLDRIRELQATYTLPDNIDLMQRGAELEKWAQEQRRKHLLDIEFRAHQRQLLIQLESSEQKDTAARAIGTHELREDYEHLTRIWRSLVEFGRSLPDEMTTRFKKRVAILELQLRRRQQRKIALICAASVLTLTLTAVAAVWFIGKVNAGDLAKRIKMLAGERQVRQLEQLLETTRKENPQQGAQPDVRESVAIAEKVLTEEFSKLKTFQTLVNAFPPVFTPNNDEKKIGEWSKVYNTIVEAHRALAPILATETASVLDGLEKRWNYLLEEESGRRQAQLEQLLQMYGETLAGFDFNKPVEDCRSIIKTAHTARKNIDSWIKQTGEILKLRSDSLAHFRNLSQRHQHYSDEINKFDSNIYLNATHQITDYQSLIEKLADSEFTRDRSVAAARAIKGKLFPADALTQVLLCGQNTNLWNQIKDGQMPDFRPKSVMPTEQKLFATLKSTESAAAASHKYEFVLASKEMQRVLLMEELPGTPEPGWKKYDGVVLDRGATQFTRFEKIELGFFGNSWKLANNSPFTFKHLGQTPEPMLFFKAELHKNIGEPGSAPRMQLVKTLDVILEDSSTSPLFRAWLFLQLVSIMEVQPDAWGLPFAPLIQKHRRDLVAAGGETIKQGDWYIDNLNKKLGPDLEGVFAAQRPNSFYRQAELLANLFRVTVSSGFEFAGHIDLDGNANIHRDAQDELWGFDLSEKPVLMFRKVSSSWLAVSEVRRPFAPLYSLKNTRSNLLKSAGVEPKDPLLDGQLPALFAVEAP